MADLHKIEPVIVGVADRNGNPLRYFEDGLGNFYVYGSAYGVMGVVHARTADRAKEILGLHCINAITLQFLWIKDLKDCPDLELHFIKE